MMPWLSVLSALMSITAVVLLVPWTPEEVAQELLAILKPRESLYTMGQKLRRERPSKGVYAYLMQTKMALETSGRGQLFPGILCVSLLLSVMGLLVSMLLENPFLAPVSAAALAALPFAYVGRMQAQYKRHVRRELETTLAILTISYTRCDDILTAVEENLAYIKPPLQEAFRIFLSQATLVSSNIRQALEDLSLRVDDEMFREWCHTLILCQEDRTLKDTLQPIVDKLTHMRLVNRELSTMLSSVRSEYGMMVALVVGNIPLLYVLNRDWYHTLMDTTPGNVVLAVCGVVILVTAFLMARFTRPMEYRR